MVAAKARREQAAARPSDVTDLRTAGQREADLLLHLLTHGTHLPSTKLQLVLHCPVETLQDRSDEPGLLVGVGLLDAGHCRELAVAATAVLAVGVPPESRLPVLMQPAGGREVTIRTVEPGYVPSARLGALVRARHPLGAAPMASSWRHDLDHRTPWPQGPTSVENLVPLGRRWHRLKHAGFAYHPGPDGSVLWTSPRGRQVRVPASWTKPSLRQPPTGARACEARAPATGPPRRDPDTAPF